MHALAAWAKNKSIYDFDENIAEELIDSFDSAADLPVEAFDGMPYDGVYISVRDTPIAFLPRKIESLRPLAMQYRALNFTYRRSNALCI